MAFYKGKHHETSYHKFSLRQPCRVGYELKTWSPTAPAGQAVPPWGAAWPEHRRRNSSLTLDHTSFSINSKHSAMTNHFSQKINHPTPRWLFSPVHNINTPVLPKTCHVKIQILYRTILREQVSMKNYCQLKLNRFSFARLPNDKIDKAPSNDVHHRWFN